MCQKSGSKIRVRDKLFSHLVDAGIPTAEWKISVDELAKLLLLRICGVGALAARGIRLALRLFHEGRT